ncbi:hypothetical protein Tc00.1047053510359.540 [Trypanosoma cruzi]|uniref:Uncharacterized protein n=1 Tax=Trypanosoma cruzi (strain CL Brener) TaxID=353153 RepID=Q4E532_TRYCC|nr:hypothetical protein Tc00.1047053510359.540 [Trypanosoma cruzi]EAN99912.1 hypothetical protein Tc00.1047053510359.540 [Trypanosoma cruzi]|eukprot:XP_821763.1 hypothetical protein [Trypanosoma cruzi strain CL Brener]
MCLVVRMRCLCRWMCRVLRVTAARAIVRVCGRGRSVLLPVLRLSMRIILSVALVCACMAGMVSCVLCAVCHVANAVHTCSNCAASCARKEEGATVASTMNVTTHKYAGLYELWWRQFPPMEPSIRLHGAAMLTGRHLSVAATP